MHDSRSPEPDEPAQPAPALVVAVTRTGGFAGIARAWTAEPREAEAPEWMALIARCPWDERLESDPRGADRFQWSIRAQCGPEEDREAELPDRAVQGPWRDLVDAVREWSAGNPSH
ncbi:protealysin inhibitor emfourin [Microbacterium sp. SS28]|uniref:protealysin inhibitor emfourin n=1 Tax=Microbacterium sp. SS28 TaxID=2919948 RepID=UPI001FA985DF|nr:protealysin inhibitor emfourin [Microbacterium sp. SS28]